MGGILIAVFYLFGAFGVSAAIPYNELSVDSGFMDAAGILLAGAPGIILSVIGFLFMFSLIANLSLLVVRRQLCRDVRSRDHAMPKVFEKENKDEVPRAPISSTAS